MKIAEVMGIVSKEAVPTVVRIPAFAGLPDDMQRELQGLLAPFVARNVPMAADPVLPETMVLELEGRLFRVSVVTDRATGGASIVILGPNLEPWTRDMLEALLPPEHAAPEAPPVRLGDLNIRRSQAEILEDVLIELKAIRAALARP